MNAQKRGEHEAEIERIKNVFMSILRDIKKEIDSSEQPGETVTAAHASKYPERRKGAETGITYR